MYHKSKTTLLSFFAAIAEADLLLVGIQEWKVVVVKRFFINSKV